MAWRDVCASQTNADGNPGAGRAGAQASLAAAPCASTVLGPLARRAIAIVTLSVDALETGAMMALSEGEGCDERARGTALHRASGGRRSQPTIDSATRVESGRRDGHESGGSTGLTKVAVSGCGGYAGSVHG